jgi:CIC family chloride channel protein
MDDHTAAEPVPSNPLRWFPEFLQWNRQRFRGHVRVLGSSLLVGVIAGVGAAAFSLACHVVSYFALGVFAGYHPITPAGEPHLHGLPELTNALQPWMLLVVPTIGGLICGIIVYTLAPEAEGHGTDAAIAAYHQQRPIRFLVPYVKIVASAITLGCGGSGGREGPIAQVGAGFGSFWAGLLRLGPTERRILTAAGMGAGIAAIFRAPLAGALFAAEVLYWSPEFEPEVIIPAGIGSVIAYSTFGAFFGWQPLFEVKPALSFDNPYQLGPYVLLAVFMAVLAMIYTRTFYFVTFLFRRLPLRRHFKPAIGSLLTGMIGLLLYFAFAGDQQVLSVMSFGYGILQDTVRTPLHQAGIGPVVLLAVALGKILTTSLTIGSGGSGGVFGPSMVIGGCAGGALGLLFHDLAPDLVPHPASFALVGMAGFFAAAAKTPFSTLVMVGELTGNYGLLLPTLWVCTIAFLLSDKQSIYSSQVEGRAQSPAHQGSYLKQIVGGLPVSRLLTLAKEVPLLHPNDTLTTVFERFSDTPSLALPVVDDDKNLLGLVNLDEVHVALQGTASRTLLRAADLMRSEIPAVRPSDTLDYVAELMTEHNVMALAVVEDAEPRRVIGLIRRRDITRACLSLLNESATQGTDVATS